MKRFSLIIALFSLLLIIGGGFLFSGNREKEEASLPTPADNSYEYYWSETCPHCKKVNEFMSTWEGKDKINLNKMEVGNKQYANFLRQRAKSCNIPSNQVGVPLLYTPEGKCLVGDTPIIEFFKQIKFEEKTQE